MVRFLTPENIGELVALIVVVKEDSPRDCFVRVKKGEAEDREQKSRVRRFHVQPLYR